MTEAIINWQPSHLQDDLVRLQPLTEYDFDSLFQIASDRLIWEQHPAKDRYKKEVLRVYFDDAIASGSAFLIIDKISDAIIGCTRYYDYKPDEKSIAIGFTFLSRNYWGGRYNKSVKKLMLDYAFRFVDNVYFHIGANNIRSQLGTAKLGAVKVGEINRDHSGQSSLHYEYLIQKEEWKG